MLVNGFTLSGVGLATPRETNFKHGMKLTLSPDISSNSSMSLKKSITFSRLFFEYEMKSYRSRCFVYIRQSQLAVRRVSRSFRNDLLTTKSPLLRTTIFLVLSHTVWK